MKIEKVNENQIRCTLTKTDLQSRQIRISELAYGSEKARLLFRDMIQQANQDFGFEVNDIPLMVEAIPTSAESIILLITKVEYPEELDTRFSKFSDPDEDMFDFDDSSPVNNMPLHGADDILDLFEKIRKAKAAEQEELSGEAAVSGEQDNEKEVLPESVDLTRMYEFSNMEQLTRLAGVLNGYYAGENDLYKNVRKNRFYLMLHNSEHTPQEFNKVCNIISEYARQKNYTDAVGAFFEEHGKLIIKGNALQTLASL
jgi:adapter protein MecA 1/2